MNLQQFQYVLAVAELRHFETAAEKCFVTQSTLSTMISRFESEIGIQVFNRRTKPVTLTSEGRKIIERLKVISKEVDTLNNVVQELKGELTGELRLGIIPTVSPYLLPLFLSKFAALFPKVRVIVQELTTAQIQTSLKSRQLDIGILALPLEEQDLKEYPLYVEPFMIFDCTKEKGRGPVSIQDLDYSRLWFLEEGHCLRTQVQQICEQSNASQSKDINFEFKAGSMDSLIRFTKANEGITVLPYMATSDLSFEDRQFIKEIDSPTPVRTIGLLTHEHFVKKQLSEKLSSIIRETVRERLPEINKALEFSPI